MEKQGKVSLWIGDFNSKEDFNNFTKEAYDDKEEVFSEFMNSFQIEFIDNQFQEIDYYNNLNTKEDVFEGFSYIESFIKKIPDLDWNKKNSIILLYNFEYNKKVEKVSNFKFIDTYDYTEE